MTSRRSVAWFWLGVFAIPLFSQHPATPMHSADRVYVSPALGLTGRTPEAALNEPFPGAFDVTVGISSERQKRSVRNCSDLLVIGGKKYTTGFAPDDSKLHALGARCYALDWLRAAKAPAQPLFRNFSFRQLQVRSLPPELALAISDQEAEEVKKLSLQGESILAVEPDAKLRVVGPEKAKLTTDDWTALLTVYAHGDFLGDGTEQLLLRSDTSATGGSYTSTRLFLLARGKPILKVVREQ